MNPEDPDFEEKVERSSAMVVADHDDEERPNEHGEEHSEEHSDEPMLRHVNTSHIEDDGTFDDTAEALLLQIENTLHETEATVVTEVNATILDEARHLRSLKHNLEMTITRQLKNLIIRTHICRFKHTSDGRLLFGMNTTITMMGIFIALYATIIGIVELEQNQTLTGTDAIIVKSVTPVIGAVVAVVGGLIQGKKLSQKLEVAGNIVDKSAYIQSRLPSLIDRVRSCNTILEFEKVEAEYRGETRTLINSCEELIGRVLKLEDMVVHAESIQYFQLRRQASEAEYVVESARIAALKDQRLERLSETGECLDESIDVSLGYELPTKVAPRLSSRESFKCCDWCPCFHASKR